MAGGEESRRSGLTINAVDPIDGKSCTIQISHGRLQFIKQLGLRAIHETAKLVPLALQKPTAIFEGLTTDEDEERGRGAGWRCYVTKPTIAFRATGVQHPAPVDQVFLVFVNSEHVAYNWRWEKCDPVQTSLPEGYEERFRKRLL